MAPVILIPVVVMILTLAYTKWRGDQVSELVAHSALTGFLSFVVCGLVLVLWGADEGRIKNKDVSGFSAQFIENQEKNLKTERNKIV